MKPKNNLERKMLALAEKLPPITDKQRRYAYEHSFNPLAVYYIRKREIRCLCCGETMVYPKEYIQACIDANDYSCPFCGKSMSIKSNTDCHTEYQDRKFFTILTTFRGNQVARTFEVSRINSRYESFARYDINEIFQTWILDDGKEVITGRPYHRSAYCMGWYFDRPLDIKHHNQSTTGMYAYDDTFNIAGCLFYPEVRVTPLLRRNGWSKKIMEYSNVISMTDAMQWLLQSPTAEMLVKTGQFDLFFWMVRHNNIDIQPWLHSVRIANRNHYIVKDAQMWIDMLTMAARLNIDTHNPKYVCPPDLYKAHDAILKRHTVLQQKINAEKRRKEALKWEAKYKAEKAMYFGICFGNEKVVITVMKSVADIAAEGEAMHHCVYSAGYYKKSDSLILSARDHEGKRIETIELSLKSFQVLQSRGVCNKTTEYHDEILSLVKQNINLFKQIKQSVA